MDNGLIKGVSEWTKMGVITQIAPSLIAICALVLSIKTYRESRRSAYFSELDSIYLELQKLTLADPKLLVPNPTDINASDRYNIYAFMIWNFIETSFDRSYNNPILLKTWYPIIFAEINLHRKWFDSAENYRKFKHPFRMYIDNNLL